MQKARKTNSEMARETQIMLMHIESQRQEVMDIYAKASAARLKWYSNENYSFTDEDRDYLIMLASAYSAILRHTFKLFVTERGFESGSFWDAFIFFNICKQWVLFSDAWANAFRFDKELPRLIKRTSNPVLIEKIFTGDMSLKWLVGELSRQVGEL